MLLTSMTFVVEFGMANEVGSLNRVLDGRAHWRHLASTGEPQWVGLAPGVATPPPQIALDNLVHILPAGSFGE